jgi:alpha-amylase/alpha-mannosidase (GH57 family)
MHQPFYKNLVSGEYKLPWARLHALKDYYGMVKILDDFPEVRQTFNLVPSLLLQIEDYAGGNAPDPFLRLALKKAEDFEPHEKEFVLRYFFQANPEHAIGRYSRYAELFRIMQQCDLNPLRAIPAFDAQKIRDLQVLSQIAWFDEELLRNDPDIRELVARGRDFTIEDQARAGSKQREALSSVIPTYADFYRRGQIELSVSAFYHPILPLLCDSNVASVSHPYIPLPAQFSYPGDAEEQLRRAQAYFEEKFGTAARGLWPSEGSVSDQTLDIAAKLGFQWTASDDGVLAQSLGQPVSAENTYRPYRWRCNHREISVVFRDHRLSDLIGFVYSRMDADEAAEHFMREVRKNCTPILKAGRDALVPIILDGENAWESYTDNGRPFLRELYARISADSQMQALTISEALKTTEPRELSHIFPGSWIDANFDIWIGADEDNRAWDQLRRARVTYDKTLRSSRAAGIPDDKKRAAWEELLIAEGSDWCWWYGPEHSSANRGEFDQLYRDHLANVYRLLGLEPPQELSQSNLKEAEAELHELPGGLIEPVIDGVLTSRSEWSDAGRYRIDHRSGAMHSQPPLIRELMYGSDGRNLFLAIELNERPTGKPPFEFQLRIRAGSGERYRIRASAQRAGPAAIETDLPADAVSGAIKDLCEIRISMNALGLRSGESFSLQLALYRENLPVALLPTHGEVRLRPTPMTAFAF